MSEKKLAWKDSKKHDPKRLPADLSDAGLAAAVEIWKTTMDRFYRRRQLAWTVWLGLWAIPGTLIGALAIEKTLLENAGWAWLVISAAAVLAGTVTVWAWFTWQAHRKDHARGMWWYYRLRKHLGVKGRKKADVEENAGHLRVSLDVFVPWVLTMLFLAAAVWVLVDRVSQ